MKNLTKYRFVIISIGVIILLITAFISGAIIQPTWIKTTWIRMTSKYDIVKYHRLGQLLKEGMNPGDVENIMGSPNEITNLKGLGSERWLYTDMKNPACGPNYVVIEFYGNGICYVSYVDGTFSLAPSDNKYSIGKPHSEWIKDGVLPEKIIADEELKGVQTDK